MIGQCILKHLEYTSDVVELLRKLSHFLNLIKMLIVIFLHCCCRVGWKERSRFKG